jgi:hypothetical protein
MTAKEARKWFAHFKTIDHAGKFISPEDFYQAIKARLKDELAADTHGTSHYGVLVDSPNDIGGGTKHDPRGDVER